METPKPGPKGSPILPLSQEGGMGKVLSQELQRAESPATGEHAGTVEAGAGWGQRPQEQQEGQGWA